MKTITVKELREILEKHRKWLKGEDGGERANLSYTDLRCVNLSYTNLRCADLSYANLHAVNLHNANLRDANLCGADLSDADLCEANLRYANLRYANLSDADLRGLSGNFCHIKSLQIETYSITYTSKVIQIGCERYTIEEWKNFDDEKIKQMDEGVLEWCKKWKPILMQIIELSPCEETK